jgi:hypothetical protein
MRVGAGAQLTAVIERENAVAKQLVKQGKKKQ